MSKKKEEFKSKGEALLKEIVQKALIVKKARDIKAINVAGIVDYSDLFLICSATSEQHVRALARQIQVVARDSGYLPLAVEGTRFNRWVLIDFGTVMIHVFLESLRQFYDLERLWVEGKELDLQLPEPQPGDAAFWDHLEEDQEWLDDEELGDDFVEQDQDPEMPDISDRIDDLVKRRPSPKGFKK